MTTVQLESSPFRSIGGLNKSRHERDVLYVDPDLGRIFVQDGWRGYAPGEIGIVVAKQKRPIWTCGALDGDHLRLALLDPANHGVHCLDRYAFLWDSITHNERVDDGAAEQADMLFGAGGTIFLSVAVATTGFTTKTKTDSGIGIDVGGATITNEFSTIGLSRGSGTLGTYTAPASLGATFSQVVSKVFTASGGGTAHGSALFNSNTPTGSILYVEDIFSSDAVLVTSDTLTVNWTITN